MQLVLLNPLLLAAIELGSAATKGAKSGGGGGGGTLGRVVSGVLTNPIVMMTVAGLVAIPLIITSLDTLAHWTLNGSYRMLSDAVLEEE